MSSDKPRVERNDGIPTHDELPLANYDHLPVGTLRDRIRTLDAAGVEQLLAYERAHGNRTHVIEVIRARLADFEHGATPSGGSPKGAEPEIPPPLPPEATSPVSPQTAAPPATPPSHGVPTNRRQPR